MDKIHTITLSNCDTDKMCLMIYGSIDDMVELEALIEDANIQKKLIEVENYQQIEPENLGVIIRGLMDIGVHSKRASEFSPIFAKMTVYNLIREYAEVKE